MEQRRKQVGTQAENMDGQGGVEEGYAPSYLYIPY